MIKNTKKIFQVQKNLLQILFLRLIYNFYYSKMSKNNRIKNKRSYENFEEEDYFQIVYNHRRIEKSKRRKQLKKYKEDIQRDRFNSKMATFKTENRPQRPRVEDNEQFIWDVLFQDSFDFKWQTWEFQEQVSNCVQSQKTDESFITSNKLQSKKSLFLNQFSPFQFTMV